MDGRCPCCGHKIRSAPTANNAIERYYRSRARSNSKKLTLRQLAEQTGYSYAYLLKAKQRYDAAGKWGSKKRVESV